MTLYDMIVYEMMREGMIQHEMIYVYILFEEKTTFSENDKISYNSLS